MQLSCLSKPDKNESRTRSGQCLTVPKIDPDMPPDSPAAMTSHALHRGLYMAAVLAFEACTIPQQSFTHIYVHIELHNIYIDIFVYIACDMCIQQTYSFLVVSVEFVHLASSAARPPMPPGWFV